MKRFQSLLSWILITQMFLATLAPAWARTFDSNAPVATAETLADDAPELSYGGMREEIVAFDEVLQGRSNATGNRLDTFGLFDWDVPTPALPSSPASGERSGKNRVVDIGNLALRITDAEGRQQTIYNAYHNLAKPQGRSLGPASSVEILFRGEVVLKSRFPVQSVAFYKDYLVFLEPGTFQQDQTQNQSDAATDETGVQPLSFVDLKTYGALLNSQPVGIDTEGDAAGTGFHGAASSAAPLAPSSSQPGDGAASSPLLSTSMPRSAPDPRAATLPIFSMPVGAGSAAQVLQAGADGMLALAATGSTVSQVPADALKVYADVQQTSLDVTAALVDPKTYESAGPAVEEAERYFMQAIHQAGQGVPSAMRRGEAFAGRMTLSLLTRHASLENLEADPAFAASVADIQKFTVAQQKASHRLRLLWQRLSLPRPAEGPKKIREALAMMVAGLRATDDQRQFLLREGALQVATNPYVKWGTGVAAAALLGTLYPVQVSHFLYEALDVSRVVVEGLFGRVRGMGRLAWEASRTAFSGFTKPAVFYRAYLTPEHRWHFLVGVTAYFGTALSMLAIPFLPVNAWLLARDIHKMDLPGYGDFRRQDQGIAQSGISFLKSRVDAFVDRQRQMRAQHLRDQNQVALERARAQGRDAVTNFTSKDDAELDEIFAGIKVKNRSWVSRCFEKVKGWKVFRRSTHDAIAADPDADPTADIAPRNDEVESLPQSPSQAEEQLATAEIQGFGSALRAFLFSTESVGAAAKRDVRGWNGFSIFRSAFLSPTMFFKMITAPNFYNVALGDGRGTANELTVPTELNGGLIGPLEAGRRVFRMLTFDKNLEALHAWEEKIIIVEKEVLQEAIREGFRGLGRFISARGESLEALIRSGGIESMSDPVVATLTTTQRAFFQNYVDELVTRGMQGFLTRVAQQSDAAPALDARLPLRELKRLTLGEIEALRIEPGEARRIVAAASQEGDAYRIAENVATEALANGWRRFSTVTNYSALSTIDPAGNRTMRQIQITLQAMEKKDAMPRALRAVIPQVLMKKSIGFFFTLVGLAGVTSGIMQPLHSELFGPNSYFHLGRMPFVAGNLVGLFITLFEGIPVKLQRDSAHAAHFGAVPEGEDANRSVVSWYFKQTFRNPSNSYGGNQKLHWQIFFGQLKPALVMSLFAGLASLGRFDMDGFMTYLFLGSFNPANGFDSQLEQGMEFASFYHLKDFPERLRNHPRVLEYLANKQAGLRFWFAFWEKIWVDAKGLVLGLMTRMDFPRGNHQAFLRMLDTSGKTPTERAYEFLENWVRKPLRFIPGVNQVVSACESVLTNNYEDWQKVMPPWFRPGSHRSGGHGGH